MAHFDYYGIPLPRLEDNTMAVGAVVCIKTIDEGGRIVYQEFKSPDIHAVEALGMLTTFTDTMRHHIMGNSREAGQ